MYKEAFFETESEQLNRSIPYFKIVMGGKNNVNFL